MYGDFVRQEPYTFATSAYWVPLSKLIKNVTSSEPAWAKWTMMELFMTDRHQHLPAATMLHVLDAPRCAIAEHHNAVGQQARDEQQQQRDRRREGAARTTVGLTCSHRRHERRERRDQPAFAIARNILYLIFFSYLIY